MGATRYRSAYVLIWLVTIAGLLIFTDGQTSTNPASRFATAQSLVDFGTYDISRSRFQTIDKMRVDGRMLSSKPPVLPTAMAGVYWGLKHLFGWTFDQNADVLVITITLLFCGLPHLVLLACFLRYMRLFDLDEPYRVIALAVFAGTYLGWGYATVLNNHTPPATALMGAVLLAFATDEESRRSGARYAAIGFLAALATVLDLGAAVFAVALFMFLLMRSGRARLGAFVLGALPPLAVHFGLTYYSTGSLIPLYFRPEVHDYPGSYWLNPGRLDALHEPKIIYFLNLTIGHHGLFSTTPALAVGVYEAVRRIGRRGEQRKRALMLLCAFALVFLYYLFQTHNYGGACRGFRFMIFCMPPLFVYFGLFLARRGLDRWSKAVIVVSALVGGLTSLGALKDPFGIPLMQQALSDQAFTGLPDPPASPALCPARVLDALASMPARPAGRKPCVQAQLGPSCRARALRVPEPRSHGIPLRAQHEVCV